MDVVVPRAPLRDRGPSAHALTLTAPSGAPDAAIPGLAAADRLRPA